MKSLKALEATLLTAMRYIAVAGGQLTLLSL